MSNPYQVYDTQMNVRHAADGYRVDGKFVVVSTGTALPPVCVKTNQPLSDDDMVTKHFTWCSPVLVPLFFVSNLVGFLIYLLLRKHCLLTYGVHADVRCRYRTRMFKKVAAIFGSLGTIVFAANGIAASPAMSIVLVFGVFALILSLLFLLRDNSPLRIAKYRKGEFWLAGCSDEFLAAIA